MQSRSEKAFSLLEVVIAVGILAVGILTVIALFTQLLRSSHKASDSSLAVAAAESFLNQTISNIFNDTEIVSKTDFWNDNAPPADPIERTVNPGGKVMTYRITYQTVNDTAGDPLGDDLPENRSKKVDIVLWWFTDDPAKARPGYGYLRVSASRLINEQEEF